MKRERTPAHSKKRGLIRVASYIAVMGTAMGIAYHFAPTVRAQEIGAVRGIGDDMMSLRGLLGPDPRRLHLNGQALWVAHATTKLSVHEVLDRFQANCTAQGASPWTWQEAEKRPVADLQKEIASMQLGAMREEIDEGGVVLCFAPTGDATFLDRALRFRRSGDLGAFGKMRLVRATKANGYVNVVSSWTDGSFDSEALFGEPKPGVDSAGEDSRLTKRPLGSLRVMSSTVEGAPYATYVYERGGAPKETLVAYGDELKKDGWDYGFIPVIGENDVRRAFKRGNDVIVVSTYAAKQGRSRVVVSELGSDPTIWDSGLLKPAD